MSNSYQSGDVTINKLNLISLTDGSRQDILAQTSTISIYEDIFQNCLHCEITVLDPVGLLRTLPIIGQELCEIEFLTPGRTIYSATFWVYKVAKVSGNDIQTTQGFVLRMVSVEEMYDKSSTCDKGYMDSISNIIQDVLKNYLNSTKKIFYEPTKGVQHIVMTRLNGFDAIAMVQKRASSIKYKSSSFLFFENKYGFNFTTLENLMATNQSLIGDKIFTRYTASSIELQSDKSFRNIIAGTQGSQFNIMEAVNMGGLNNLHQSFDLVKKSIKETKYNLTNFDQFSSTDPKRGTSPIAPSVYQKLGSDPAIRMFNLSDSSKPDTFINDFLPYKIAYSTIQYTGTLDIHIHGDSSLSIGDVITIEIPETNAFSKDNITLDPLVNGNYIIGKLHHQITVFNTRPVYMQTATLIRGTYKL